MFTVEQRDDLRERVLQLAHGDERVVAGALVGSLAVGTGDAYSDLDLTFGVAEEAQVADVLDDWTVTLSDDLAAVQLADLLRGPTTYRVFLLEDLLQLDLSMTPAPGFRRQERTSGSPGSGGSRAWAGRPSSRVGSRMLSAPPLRARPRSPKRPPRV